MPRSRMTRFTIHRAACGTVLAASWLLAMPAVAATPAAPKPAPTIASIVANAPTASWRPIPPEDLLVMRLAGGQRIVIELAPAFAPVHVANIRALARAGWWNGTSIVRAQDNYVVQWARMPEGQPLPATVVAHPAAEYDRPAAGMAIRPLGHPDPYAPQVGFVDDWPAASDGRRDWLVHCYGMVGVGRDLPPDTGTGEELYAVIGQAPRQLDRNIALVGRVVDGMAAFSSLPRGTAALGFYDQARQRVPIASFRLAADLPEVERPRVEAMRTDSPAFADLLAARANRTDPFFVRPGGGLDICNAIVPTRIAKTPDHP